MSDDNKKLEGHSYDGIDELDNALPKWWINLFYLTIVFSIGYYFYYTLGGGPTLKKEYEVVKDAYDAKQLAMKASVKLASEDELQAILKDPRRLQSGRETFIGKCASCHGTLGQGGIGPNLTDRYWLHGGSMVAISQTVMNGVLDKGMPPWGPLLKQDEIESVTAFVKSLKDSHPSGAKPPQGEQVKE